MESMRSRSSEAPKASTGHACATVVVIVVGGGGGGEISRSMRRRLLPVLPLLAALLACLLLRPTAAYQVGSPLFANPNPSVQAIGDARFQGRAKREAYPSSFVRLVASSATPSTSSTSTSTESRSRPPLRSLVRRPLASFFRRIFNNKRKDNEQGRSDSPELIVTEMDGAGGGYDPVPGGADSDDPTALSASSSALAPLSSLLAPPSMPGPTPPSSSSPQSPTSSSSPLGGVVGVMEQLEAFRASQRVGAQTSQLLNDLQNYVQVDAASYGNHVKITMDGRQRVKAVEVDDQFLKTSEPYEVSAAVLEALQLAHDKSTDKMDEKVKAFYAKLGLLGGSGGGV